MPRTPSTTPVRLLVGYTVDDDHVGAQHTNTKEIVARLDPDRFHVTAFADGDRVDPRLAERPNTRIVHLPERRKTLRILRTLLTGRFDVAFCLPPAPASLIYAQRRRLPARTRLVTTLEGTIHPETEALHSRSVVAARDQLIDRADLRISISEFVRRWWREHRGRDSIVIPLGVDLDRFRPSVDRDEPPTAVCVGSLILRKRCDLMLELAARAPDARVVIVGGGPLSRKVAAEVRSRGLANVALLGKRSPDEVAELLARATVLFHPGEGEGVPKVTLEAAACRVPAVARAEYEPSSVVHGVSGWLCRSDRELLDAAVRLLAEPARARAMGEAARALAERFSWDQLAPAWADAIASQGPGLPVTPSGAPSAADSPGASP